MHESRNKRKMPGLDSKIITGWNGLMLSGLIDAYDAFGDTEFLNLALANANFINDELIIDNRLQHTYDETKTINGFLDDYAAVIQAFIKIYQSTFDEKWLLVADALTNRVLDIFYDNKSDYFYFSEESADLITRKMDLVDNVIPASNSLMASNFYLLGKLLDVNKYLETAERMLSKIYKLIIREPNYMTQWAILYGYFSKEIKEVVIVGEDAKIYRSEMAKYLIPNVIFTGTNTTSNLPLIVDKKIESGTRIYVCENKTCKLPVDTVQAALGQL